MNDNLSPADIKAVVGSPVYPYANGMGSGFGDGGWLWLILILALMGGWGNGNGNGFGGGFGNDFAWLSNGQKEIMQNTNQGFDTLHLSNQLEGARDGINALSTQLCNCCADMNQTVSNGFYNAEIGANNRQMANMQQAFNSQISTLQGFNDLSRQTDRVNATVLSENCQDRFALAEGVRDIITNQTANTQNILDKLCQLELDGKQDKIDELQRELTRADLRASQLAQTEAIKEGIYNELKNCPVGTVPVFGNQPIFTCSNNLNNGCGCGLGNTIV